MRPDELRVLAAIRRNFEEADQAILKLTAYRALSGAPALGNGVNGMNGGADFFAIAERALYNDAVASVIRIFDDHKEAGSFWYVIRCCADAALVAAKACDISIDNLRSIAPRLQFVRNRTHFHIDKRALDNPSGVWAEAGLSVDEMDAALRAAARLLAQLKRDRYGGRLESLTPYDAADIADIIALPVARTHVPP